MTHTSTGLVVVAALLLLTPAALGAPDGSQSQPVREINNCGVISEPGRYVLSQDILNGGSGDGFTYASQSCIVVRSDDVVIEGNGHRVDALGNSDTTGIAVLGTEGDPAEDVTVANVTLTDWNRGVYYRHAESGTIRGVTMRTNAYGASIEHSTNTRVVDSNAVDNLIGVYEGSDSVDTRLARMSYDGNYAGDFVSDAPANETGAADEAVTTADETNSPTATPTATPTPTPTPTPEEEDDNPYSD